MALQCGLVGLPNVGKSTLFNALSQAGAEAANFPFCTIDPNVGVVQVPDPRLTQLEQLVQPQRVLPTTMEFVDIAGLVKGASQGEGLGNQFLGHIRSVDAIVHVVRCFDDTNIIHVAGHVDPVFDLQVIDYELQQKDLESLKKRLLKWEKQARTGDREATKQVQLSQQLITVLQTGKNLRAHLLEPEDAVTVSQWQLLTTKPVLYVANVDEATLQAGTNAHFAALESVLAPEGAPLMMLCVALEEQIADLDVADRPDFLAAYGLEETGLNRLIQAAYQRLGLITYFTAGPQEVRAWTIPKGTLAPQAAGVIHSDFERGFIKAEVVKLHDLEQYGNELNCRKAGKVAIEGKGYEVQDGDILHFRFNV